MDELGQHFADLMSGLAEFATEIARMREALESRTPLTDIEPA